MVGELRSARSTTGQGPGAAGMSESVEPIEKCSSPSSVRPRSSPGTAAPPRRLASVSTSWKTRTPRREQVGSRSRSSGWRIRASNPSTPSIPQAIPSGGSAFHRVTSSGPISRRPENSAS